jgi:fibronectin type 3 domain-containing protein
MPLAVLALSLAGCHGKSTKTAVERVGNHKVILTWPASTSPVMGYRVYRATNPDDPPVLIGVTPADRTQFTDVTVASGHTYFYVVTAFNSADKESAASNKVSAKIPVP